MLIQTDNINNPALNSRIVGNLRIVACNTSPSEPEPAPGQRVFNVVADTTLERSPVVVIVHGVFHEVAVYCLRSLIAAWSYDVTYEEKGRWSAVEALGNYIDGAYITPGPGLPDHRMAQEAILTANMEAIRRRNPEGFGNSDQPKENQGNGQ